MNKKLRNLGNYPKGKLIFVAARPGNGLKGFALSSHLFHYINNQKSAYLTLEDRAQTFERNVVDNFYNEMLNLFHIEGDIVTSKDVFSNFSLASGDYDIFS